MREIRTSGSMRGLRAVLCIARRPTLPARRQPDVEPFADLKRRTSQPRTPLAGGDRLTDL